MTKPIAAVLFGVLLGESVSIAHACISVPMGSRPLALVSVTHDRRADDSPAEVARWTATATWDEATRTLTLADGRTLRIE